MTEKKGVLDLTDNGIISYRLLDGCMIASPRITETLFNQMEEVGKFKLNADKVVEEITQITVHDMKKMRENADKIEKGDIMSESGREKVSGLWNGQEVTFNREWGGYRFSDEEIEDLLDGKSIVIEPISSKTGKPYKCKGHFAEQSFTNDKGEEVSYWGFEREGFINDNNNDSDKISGVYEPTGDTVRFKKVWGGHTFTDSEIEALLAGDNIEFDAVSKNGKNYVARGRLEEQEWNGRTFWGFKANFN